MFECAGAGRYTNEWVKKDILKIYSDKNALPFFNSDNCHGDNFYYPTKEKMDSAIDSMIPVSFFCGFYSV